MAGSGSKGRNESMLFNYETVARTDYRDGLIRPMILTKYKEKSPCLRHRPPPIKNTNTITDWKIPNVPFNLMHKPKAIVQENPWIPQPSCEEVDVDELRKEVQMKRPRVVMTPAVSLDDVDDSARDKLLKDMYLSTMMKVERESGIDQGTSVRAHLSPVYAPPNPISLPKLKPPYVSPEWRMDSVSWDNRQLRAYCCSTEEFWLARGPADCYACTETAQRQAKNRMRRLEKQQ